MPNNRRASENLVLIPKGKSGNPNGRPRKFTSQLTSKGYRRSEVSECILILLALTEKEIRQIEHSDNANVLEKMLAKAIITSIKEGTLDVFELVLNRAFGKPKTQVGVDVNVHAEQRITIEYYQSKLEAGVDKNDALAMALKIAGQNGISITERELLEGTG